MNVDQDHELLLPEKHFYGTVQFFSDTKPCLLMVGYSCVVIVATFLACLDYICTSPVY